MATAQHWTNVIEGWRGKRYEALWRAHSDAVNTALLERWMPHHVPRVLKTDLFDEAVGQGLYPLLARRADKVTGIDLSAPVASAAKARYPRLDAITADVRALPFPNGEFDVIVSNSTLDHFESLGPLRDGIAELHRVLAPGGELLITLDNRQNPIVALRTMKSLGALMRRLHLVPYYVGATCGHRRLRRFLRDAGFEVQALTAVMHGPPQVLARAATLAGYRKADPAADATYLRAVLRFERLATWPTRYLTGHFVAARAVKPG